MLTIVGGPMFSGKTTWIIDHVLKLTPGSYMLFKPDIDTRFGKNVCVTHHGKSYPAINLSTKKVEFPNFKKGIKTIFIDELNFFPAPQLTSAIKKLQKMEIDIIGAGLLYDYMKRPFGATFPLSKIADSFIQLYARCDICKKKAEHSYRKVDIQNQFLLGAKETYGACCNTCWKHLNR